MQLYSLLKKKKKHIKASNKNYKALISHTILGVSVFVVWSLCTSVYVSVCVWFIYCISCSLGPGVLSEEKKMYT